MNKRNGKVSLISELKYFLRALGYLSLIILNTHTINNREEKSCAHLHMQSNSTAVSKSLRSLYT